MTILICVWQEVSCQTHSLQLKSGIALVDGKATGRESNGGPYGPNLELVFTKTIYKFIRLNVNHGYVHYNTFPDFFGPPLANSGLFVNQATDDYIKSINLGSGFVAGTDWATTSFFYLNPGLEVHMLKVLNVDISASVGLLMQRSRTSSFYLEQYRIENGRIVSYTPRFSIVSEFNWGYTMGIGFERSIAAGKDLSVVFDTKMHVPNLKSGDVDDIFVAVRLGLARYF